MSSSRNDSNATSPRFLRDDSSDDARASAYARLEEELGDNMARMLVSALASPQGVRGSSSP
jgi:hypothetical protein